MAKSSRLSRFLKWATGVIASVLLLLLISINLPYVQDKLTGYAESFLKEKTGVSITIEKIAINFLGHIVIKEVLVPDQQQDTLFHLGKLEVGFQLRGIIRREIRITRVELDDVLVDLHPARDTVMNYQYLIDAFSSPSDPEAETEPEAEATGSSWDILLPSARLTLNRIEFGYCLPDSAMVMNYNIGRFLATTDRVDLLTGEIDLKRLALENSRVFIKMSADSTKTPPDTSSAPFNYLVQADELGLSDVRFQMEMDDLQLDSYVGTAIAMDNDLLLRGDTMRIEIETFDLTDSRYRMDTPSAPASPGFDYSHMSLDSIQIQLADIVYDNMNFSGEVRQIAGRDHSGFVLSGFQTRLHYATDSIELWDLRTSTPQTSIDAGHVKVTLPFLEDSTLFEQMQIKLELDSAVLSPEDVAYFVPALAEQDVFRENRQAPLRLSTYVKGSLTDLDINRFELRGWGARVGLSGNLQHAADVDHLLADLRINAIELNGAGLRESLPAGSLPDYIELPTDMLLRGRILGPLRQLELELEAMTSRPASPVAARLQLEGRLFNAMNPDQLAYDVQIDTIWVSRREMMGYLPDSFPAYIELPDAVGLAGKLQGTMDTVFANLHLEALRDSLSSEIRLAGRIDSFTNTKAMAYDIQLQELILQAREITAYLPDTTLPGYFLLPGIEQATGTFTGDIENIDAQLSVLTSDGRLEAAALLEDDAFKADLVFDDFSLQALFKDSLAYDSVVGWPAPPMALQLDVSGQGLNIDSNLLATAALRFQFLGDTIRWEEGMVLEGQIDRKSFDGRLSIHENEIDLDLSMLADFNPGMDTSAIKGNLNKLDLYALKLMQVPFDVNVGLDLIAKGKSADSLFAQINATKFSILYDSVFESSQAVNLVFGRDTAKNFLQLTLESDFIEVVAVDQSNNPGIYNEGLAKLLGIFSVNASDIQLNADSTKNLYFAVDLFDPDIFTSGIIPGLTELSPVRMSAAVDMQDSSFAIHSEIPHVKFQSFEIDSTVISVINWDALFFSKLSIPHARISENVEAFNLSLLGLKGAESDTVAFVLQQVDPVNAPDSAHFVRYRLGFNALWGDGNYRLHFDTDPVFNFDEGWRFDPDNEIAYQKEELHISDLTIRRGEQSLTIDEAKADQIEIAFNNFNLDFFSNIIKWRSDYVMGVANGAVTIDHPMGTPEIRADLQVDDFGALAGRMGTLNATAANDEQGVWDADVQLTGEDNNVVLTARYTPNENTPAAVDGKLSAQPLNLATLQQLGAGNIDSLNGRINADLTIGGTLEKPILIGQVDLQEVAVRPTMTNSLLAIDGGRIVFQKDMISAPEPIVFSDSLGNKAKLAFGLNLEYYPDLAYTGQFQAENFLLLNTTESANSLYYGRLFSGVDVRIAGTTQTIVEVNCKLTPREESSLYYIFDQGEELDELQTDENLVRFVDFELLDRSEEKTAAVDSTSKISGYNINVTANLEKKLSFTVVMDRETNDRLEGKAEGGVNFAYLPSGAMELTGQMDISGSKYFYTYQNVIKKEFELQENSTITFSGPVDDPSVDLKAGYTARTAPYVLVATYEDASAVEAAYDRLNRRQEFQVTIRAKGGMENAELSADIQYPRKIGNNSVDLVEPALAKLRSNSSEMNTQAFSLILFNAFQLSGAANTDNSIVNLKQELGDLLSSQLNSLANQYINFAEVVFDIETLSTEGTELNTDNVDFRVGLKKRFLDGRLTVEIDGVASTGRVVKDEYGEYTSDNNMQAFLENVSVEYSLNKEGSLRIRVFNQYDFDDYIGSNVIKLGGALIISKDFNRLIFKKHHQPANPEPQMPPLETEPLDSQEDNPSSQADSTSQNR